jgi:hypothetical protein
MANDDEPEPPDIRHWPVRAWIKLKITPRAQPIALMAGPPPPPEPPLDFMEPLPVTTDPRKRVFVHQELRDGGTWALRLVWDADDPETLEGEYRAPGYAARLARERVRAFWAAVKERAGQLGPLPVVGADPRP